MSQSLFLFRQDEHGEVGGERRGEVGTCASSPGSSIEKTQENLGVTGQDKRMRPGYSGEEKEKEEEVEGAEEEGEGDEEKREENTVGRGAMMMNEMHRITFLLSRYVSAFERRRGGF